MTDELRRRFLAATEADDLDELAIELRERGGDAFLRAQVDGAGPGRLAGILTGLTWKGVADAAATEPLLLDGLEHADPAVTATAIDGLTRTGRGDLADRVLPMASDPRGRVRGAVLRFARARVADRAVPLLRAALSDPEPTVRMNAVDELGELGDPATWAAVEPLCGDPDPGVRSLALWAAAALAPRDAAEAVLRAALEDPDDEVRRSAAEALPTARL